MSYLTHTAKIQPTFLYEVNRVEKKKKTVDTVYILFCGRGAKHLKFHLYSYSFEQKEKYTLFTNI